MNTGDVLKNRMRRISNLFHTLYQSPSEIISRAPGRAEILGCHTDYNHGFALSCAISRNMIGLFSKRTNNIVNIYSMAYPGKPVSFSMTNITRDPTNTWGNYGRAVIRELITYGYQVSGADILIDSTVPKSGGVSSSAALELAIAYGILALYQQPIDPLSVAQLCRRAENSDLVNSPCGFLDQGTVAMAKEGEMVLLDFLPKGDTPVSNITSIPAKLDSDVTFVIPVDLTLERQLGSSGYVVRRKMCEDSLPFWQKILGKPVTSLRDISKDEFLAHRGELNTINPIMRKRVEHIIFENDRVLSAVARLEKGDTEGFGRIMTEAGESSLALYELDENTPQLTLLVRYGRTIPGVIGIRNMGGGFSAVALALVKNEYLQSFKDTLQREYDKTFQRTLEFIEFSPSKGAEILKE
jgi:galactokinase